MRALLITCTLVVAAGCGDAGGVEQMERDLAQAGVRAKLQGQQETALRSEITQLEAALQGRKDALTGETGRANRLATQLGTTEMELSDAELLIMELQQEIKRTREALRTAQTEGEQRAFARLKKGLEEQRSTAIRELEERQARRAQDEAAWSVALQKVLPGAKHLINNDEELTRYVASFGFASDRPLFNIRVHPVFVTDDRAVTSAVVKRLRDALAPMVLAGVTFALSEGHEVTFPSQPSLRFYDTAAPDPDDSIGKIVAEWTGDALRWRK
jgi:hypothetical protein